MHKWQKPGNLEGKKPEHGKFYWVTYYSQTRVYYKLMLCEHVNGLIELAEMTPVDKMGDTITYRDRYPENYKGLTIHAFAEVIEPSLDDITTMAVEVTELLKAVKS